MCIEKKDFIEIKYIRGYISVEGFSCFYFISYGTFTVNGHNLFFLNQHKLTPPKCKIIKNTWLKHLVVLVRGYVLLGGYVQLVAVMFLLFAHFSVK